MLYKQMYNYLAFVEVKNELNCFLILRVSFTFHCYKINSGKYHVSMYDYNNY